MITDLSFCLAVGASWKQSQTDYLITRVIILPDCRKSARRNMFWINTDAALLSYLRIKNDVGGAIDGATKMKGQLCGSVSC